MEIEFRTTQLAKSCADDKARLKAFGRDRAQKLKLRLTAIRAAESLQDLRQAPGRFHALKADRAGQFAASLDEPYRLIFEPVFAEGEDPAAAAMEWSRITRVRILEIIDYHG